MLFLKLTDRNWWRILRKELKGARTTESTDWITKWKDKDSWVVIGLKVDTGKDTWDSYKDARRRAKE